MSGPKVVTFFSESGTFPALVIAEKVVVSVANEPIIINRIKSEIKASITRIDSLFNSINNKKLHKINVLNEIICKYDLYYKKACSVSDYEMCGDLSKLISYMDKVKKAEFALSDINNNLKAKIIELRDSIVRKVCALENAKKAVAESYLLCNILVDEIKIKEIKSKLEVISNIPIDRFYDFDYQNIDADRFLDYKIRLDETERLINEAGAKAIAFVESLGNEAIKYLLDRAAKEQELKNNINGRETIQSIQNAKYMTSDDLLNDKKNNMKPDEHEKKLLEKASGLLSKFSDLFGMEEYKGLMMKFDKIKAEEYSQRRTMLYDNFLLACDKLLSEDKKRSKTLNELIEVKRQLIALDTPNAKTLVDEFEKAIGLKDISKFEQLKKKAISAVEADVQKINDQHIGSVIKSAFNELGYETDENFDTMFVKNQKMFINKPTMKNYQVQIVSNSDNAMLQVEVVRTVESEHELNETTRSHEIRDIEVETEFCKDYDVVLKKLAEKGIMASHKMRKKPGEVKVKKMLSSEAGTKKAGHRSEIKREEKAKI